MEKFFIKLDREPTVQLSCLSYPSSTHHAGQPLVVFLNGISMSHKHWYPVTSILKKELINCPPLLMYDRVGQGASKGSNPDIPGRLKNHGRDCLDAAHDLRELITSVAESRLGISPSQLDDLTLIFVAASISTAIARLYATTYPATVSGLLFLDSTLANSDSVSVFPDPSSPSFQPENLPRGVTAEMCKDARKKMLTIYGSESPNSEGLWRGNLASLLLHADSLQLEGPTLNTPHVTVIRNDSEVFAEAMLKATGLPHIMSKHYFDPAWQEYHDGLARITRRELGKGPLVARGSGHLIQRDDPGLVVREIVEIIGKVGGEINSKL